MAASSLSLLSPLLPRSEVALKTYSSQGERLPLRWQLGPPLDARHIGHAPGIDDDTELSLGEVRAYDAPCPAFARRTVHIRLPRLRVDQDTLLQHAYYTRQVAHHE